MKAAKSKWNSLGKYWYYFSKKSCGTKSMKLKCSKFSQSENCKN